MRIYNDESSVQENVEGKQFSRSFVVRNHPSTLQDKPQTIKINLGTFSIEMNGEKKESLETP